MQIRKNIVITGANSGIGFQTAKGLYLDGHNIIFGSRNQQKNIQALKRIKNSFQYSNGLIKCYQLDLSKKKSIEQFVDNVKRQFDLIDILINNAGMIIGEREISELGIEMTMAINHFGHFYLTYLLFPLIKQSKEARIINVSSRAHFHTSQSTYDDLNCERRYGSLEQYSKSKLANVQFTVALADKLTKYPNIKAMCLHPGIVDTQFARDVCFLKFFKTLCCCFYVSCEDGSRTSLFLARQKFQVLQSGKYYDSNTRVVATNALGSNKEAVYNLWKTSEKIFQIEFLI